MSILAQGPHETASLSRSLDGQKMEVLKAIVALFQFYFKYACAFGRIHPDVGNGRMLPLGKEYDGRVLTFDGAFAKEFNDGLLQLAAVTRKCKRHCLDYEVILKLCHVLRWATCVVAFVRPWHALLVGALQFVVAPFSFPIAVMKLFTYGMEGVIHYAFAMLLGGLIGGYGPVFTIGPWFLAMFLGVDQVANLVVYLLWSEPFPPLVLLKHAVYGTLNTKLYYFVVFGCLRGLQVDIIVTVLSSVSLMVVHRSFMPDLLDTLGLPCSNVRFYMDHRIGHLPVVYTHAHKMHHQFQDTTAWDAHTYGNGMNEHYFLMLLDALPCMLAPSVFWVPYCFSGHLLYITWTNKPHHTRLKPGTPYDYYMNFHADHHSFHDKNYALMAGALLDFYFGTQTGGCRGTNGVCLSREEQITDIASADRVIVVKVTGASDEHPGSKLPPPSVPAVG